MDAAKRRQELAEFLRSHREALSPGAAGLRTSGRRRTPGLRREEVASMAGVGVTWYTWLEQGRDIRASRDALTRIARALQLSVSDTAYLLALARVEETASDGAAPSADPRLQLVLDSIERSPAFIVDARWDVVQFNRLADHVYDFDGYSGPFARNHFWRAYMDPERRRLYESAEVVGVYGVGLLRANYASRIGDPHFEELLRELCGASPEFAKVWGAQQTAPLELARPVVLRPRSMGRIVINSVRFLIPDRSGWLLFVLPAADAETAALFDEFARNGDY